MALKNIPGFHVVHRTAVVDQDKSTDSAYSDLFDHAKMLLDPMHVRNNIGAKIGNEKATRL